MSRRARDGALQTEIIETCKRFAQAAERSLPRTGPGRRPEIPDWVLAVMIMTAVSARQKSKWSQWRYWRRRAEEFAAWAEGHRLPSRSTFYERYPRMHVFCREAVRLQGIAAVRAGWADAGCVAVDKSLVAARGRRRSSRAQGRVSRGVDGDATWSYSQHHGWVRGYAYEVVTTAAKRGAAWPLLASVDTASRSEQRSFAEKISQLPATARYVLADAGYDSNALGEAIEWNACGRRTGRRFLCPEVRRPNVGRRRRKNWPQTVARRESRRRRDGRRRRLQSPTGRRLYARRKTCIEPFNARLKDLFELGRGTWLWGLGNNRTLLAAAVFAYQTLLAVHHRHGHRNARIKYLLDYF
jgi:hypothetical protein